MEKEYEDHKDLIEEMKLNGIEIFKNKDGMEVPVLGLNKEVIGHAILDFEDNKMYIYVQKDAMEQIHLKSTIERSMSISIGYDEVMKNEQE